MAMGGGKGDPAGLPLRGALTTAGQVKVAAQQSICGDGGRNSDLGSLHDAQTFVYNSQTGSLSPCNHHNSGGNNRLLFGGDP